MRALVTGGAGFIGSTLVDALVLQGADVVILDDLSSGLPDNLNNAANFVHGDIRDIETTSFAVTGCDVVFHQAAHRAVLRSVEHPIATDRANVEGFLNVLVAARDAGVRRVVAASSSSVYGLGAPLPTPETASTRPCSPYAVSKLAGEHYGRVFSSLYGMEVVSLRYFNVFGPRQRPDSAYAAVIPLFVEALSQGRRPVVYGDGRQSRDFTYVDDVVAANLAAAAAPAAACAGQAFNVAGGRTVSLLELLDVLGEQLGVRPDPDFVDVRPGDVTHSCADTTEAAERLGFRAAYDLRLALRLTIEWQLRARTFAVAAPPMKVA